MHAHLRAQLDELNGKDRDRTACNAPHPVNTSHSVFEAKETPYPTSSLGERLNKFDRQNKIPEDEAAVPRHTRFFASFAADDDPVYSPGPTNHANICLPSTCEDVRQARPRWEVVSPASSPYTDSEEGPVGQSEGSITSDESELPEDLAWLFNYRNAPVRWVSRIVFVVRTNCNLFILVGLSIHLWSLRHRTL